MCVHCNFYPPNPPFFLQAIVEFARCCGTKRGFWMVENRSLKFMKEKKEEWKQIRDTSDKRRRADGRGGPKRCPSNTRASRVEPQKHKGQLFSGEEKPSSGLWSDSFCLFVRFFFNLHPSPPPPFFSISARTVRSGCGRCYCSHFLKAAFFLGDFLSLLLLFLVCRPTHPLLSTSFGRWCHRCRDKHVAPRQSARCRGDGPQCGGRLCRVKQCQTFFSSSSSSPNWARAWLTSGESERVRVGGDGVSLHVLNMPRRSVTNR